VKQDNAEKSTPPTTDAAGSQEAFLAPSFAADEPGTATGLGMPLRVVDLVLLRPDRHGRRGPRSTAPSRLDR